MNMDDYASATCAGGDAPEGSVRYYGNPWVTRKPRIAFFENLGTRSLTVQPGLHPAGQQAECVPTKSFTPGGRVEQAVQG